VSKSVSRPREQGSDDGDERRHLYADQPCKLAIDLVVESLETAIDGETLERRDTLDTRRLIGGVTLWTLAVWWCGTKAM